jgi:alkaline phosphatase D
MAQGDGGAPRGRELELADILSFIKRENIRNTIWITADVHYAAAHYYDPNKEAFQDFDPFWEFIAGPLNAGTGEVGPVDASFGRRSSSPKALRRRGATTVRAMACNSSVTSRSTVRPV